MAYKKAVYIPEPPAAEKNLEATNQAASDQKAEATPASQLPTPTSIIPKPTGN